MVSYSEYIGTLVKNFEPLHDLEFKVTFCLHENVFFQRLISKDVQQRVRVRPVDYFKALIFLDYFSKVIDNDYAVCDNLENLSKALRDQERAKGEDKGEAGPSYLNLETVVFETGIFAKEKQLKSRKEMTKKQEAEVRKRYQQEKSVDLSDPNSRKPEPFYEAIGEMVISQLSDKTKPYMMGVKSRADLGALVFVDSVLSYFTDKQLEQDVTAELSKNNYFSASLTALKALAKVSSMDKIKSAIQKNAS